MWNLFSSVFLGILQEFETLFGDGSLNLGKFFTGLFFNVKVADFLC